jgi:hypothetical protein
MALWLLAGLRGRRTKLALGAKTLVHFEVSRHAKRRLLRQLEKAGLIGVEYRARKTPLVTLVEQLEHADSVYASFACGRALRAVLDPAAGSMGACKAAGSLRAAPPSERDNRGGEPSLV